jgi:PKD repeat protein
MAVGFVGGQVETKRIDGYVAYVATTENGVPDATVKLYNLHTGVYRTTTSNNDGTFTFTDVIPGHYKLIAMPPNDNFLQNESSTSGIIRVDTASLPVYTLLLARVPTTPLPEYTIEGYIKDNFDAFKAGATVVLKSLDYNGYETPAFTTNDTAGFEGKYSITTFRGLYELWATADGFRYNIEEISLTSAITDHNITLNISEYAISGSINFAVIPENPRVDVFLYDHDNDKWLIFNYTGFLFNIKAYPGNFSAIIDAPGYKPDYHSDIIILTDANPIYAIPKVTLEKTNTEKLVTTISSPTNNWNNFKFSSRWTLNHDSELFGLKFVDYGDPVTIGDPRFQVDMEPSLGGTVDGIVGGTVENEEVTALGSWLNERGPYHLYTDSYFRINKTGTTDTTYFKWKPATLSIGPDGFLGDFDNTDQMTITTNVNYGSVETLDSPAYKIRFRNLQPIEKIVFNLPTGYEISNVDSYDTTKVWVKAFNKCQINESADIFVETLKDPTARFRVEDDYVKTLEDIHFNASELNYESLPGSGVIVKYLWDFDNGVTKEGMALDYNYSDPGIYNVTLTVTTSAALSDTTWQVITVDGTPPTPDMFFQNETGVTITKGKENIPVENYPITFNGSKSRDTIDGSIPGEIDNYLWTFGDTSGNTGTGEIAIHSYVDPGVYEVTLNVTDEAGHYKLIKRKITIEDREPPTPSFKTEPQNRVVHMGKWIILNGSISTDNSDEAENLTYSWDLDVRVDSDDDGVPNNDADATGPIYNFTPIKPGTIPIALWVTDTSGNVGNSTILPQEEWWIDVIGTDLSLEPIHQEINKFIEFSKDKPEDGQKVKFKVNVTNRNEVTAWDVIVTFRVDGKVEATKTIKRLDEDDWELVSFTWKAKGAEKHNISFNVSLENVTFEQFWDNNDRHKTIEVLEAQWLTQECMIAGVIVGIIIVVVVVYFYFRRREEAEFTRKREKGKGKGKGKGKSKGKDKDKEKGKSKSKKKEED